MAQDFNISEDASIPHQSYAPAPALPASGRCTPRRQRRWHEGLGSCHLLGGPGPVPAVVSIFGDEPEAMSSLSFSHMQINKTETKSKHLSYTRIPPRQKMHGRIPLPRAGGAPAGFSWGEEGVTDPRRVWAGAEDQARHPWCLSFVFCWLLPGRKVLDPHGSAEHAGLCRAPREEGLAESPLESVHDSPTRCSGVGSPRVTQDSRPSSLPVQVHTGPATFPCTDV